MQNNKGHRQELTRLKFKKRLKKWGYKEGEGNFYAYKSHGAPCSCGVCRDKKFSRKVKYK